MRAVRPDGKQELEQELVGREPGGIFRPAVLPPYLAELARPVGQKQRLPGIEQRCIVGTIGAVIAGTCKPAPSELIIAGHVIAHRLLQAVELITAAPDQLGPTDERVVNGPPQRLPPQSRVHSVKVGPDTADVDADDEARRVVTVWGTETEVR